MDDDRGVPPIGPRRARLRKAAESAGVPLPTILVTVAVVAATYLAALVVVHLRDILLLIVVAGFIALLLNPIVVGLGRIGVRRRGVSVAIVALLGLLAFVGLAAVFGYPLANGITHLADALPGYVRDAEHGRGELGQLVRRYHVQAWVQKNAPKLINLGQGLAKPALTVGKGAFSLLLELLTIFVLVVLLLLEGTKLRNGLLGLMVPARAERYRRIAREVSRSVLGYMLGNFLTSLTAGAVVLATLVVMGVPFSFLWALWVALVDFLPMIGGALAGIPVVLFAAAHSLTAGIVVLVVFLIYTQVENHVLNPVVMSKTVKVNPLLVLVSILVGASIGSWIGGIFGAFVAALLAIPAAGAIQVLVREAWQSTAAPGVIVAGTDGGNGSGEAETAAEGHIITGPAALDE
ncbi:MAG TPA: AI-2E family transporter [Streptosporangiaceae bacterium]|nr:AI-2E family transporter [Streptosporangiaceae bacterium]